MADLLVNAVDIMVALVLLISALLAFSRGAVREIMGRLCAERFMMRTSGLESRLTALQVASGEWNKVSYIRDGSWANTPDGEKTDHATAETCVRLILRRLSKGPEKSS